MDDVMSRIVSGKMKVAEPFANCYNDPDMETLAEMSQWIEAESVPSRPVGGFRRLAER